MYVRFKILCLILFCSLGCKPESSRADSVAFTRDFIFKEGIYLTIDDLKHNAVSISLKEFIQCNPNYEFTEKGFIDLRGQKRKFKYIDSSGSIATKYWYDVFALYQDQTLYVGFLKVQKFGKLCLTMRTIITKSFLGFYIGPDSFAVNSDEGRNEGPPNLISFDSGKIYPFDLKNFEFLLRNMDKELSDEFSKLPPMEKNDKMFIYLNRLNERNPVYIQLASE